MAKEDNEQTVTFNKSEDPQQQSERPTREANKSFTDRERKEKEIKNSTIGGF